MDVKHWLSPNSRVTGGKPYGARTEAQMDAKHSLFTNVLLASMILTDNPCNQLVPPNLGKPL